MRERPLSIFREDADTFASYAEVAVDVGGQGGDQLFTYGVPPALASRVAPGKQVFVPFGEGRARVSGVVFRITMNPPAGRVVIKPIADVSSSANELTEEGRELALWLARDALATIGQAVRLLLPPGATDERVHARMVLSCHPAPEARDPDLIQQALRHAPAQKACWDTICSSPGLTPAEVAARNRCTRAAVTSLVRRGWVLLRPREIRRTPPSVAQRMERNGVRLTDAQAEALRCMTSDLQAPAYRSYLLHGVTGSGKTEVYLRAIELVLARGAQAIVLVPEIALTPQTVARFQERFGDRVAVLHSGLGRGERYDEWWRIRRGEVSVVVGARSAVFAPCTNLGLIVVDEEHETSYKQEESPRYHARDVAIWRARWWSVPVILGSATPSLETLFATQQGAAVRLNLPERAQGQPLPVVRVVDMRRHGGVPLFAPELVEALGSHLDRGQQALLFLNRRGYAPALICPECGYVAQCSICSVNLCYHEEDRTLRCHYCGARSRPPTVCPHCGSRFLRLRGVGTERVAQEVARLFPKARVLRMDLDTTGVQGSHQRIYEAFRTGEADVLVGTQMVAKGGDVAGVTRVGVIQADIGLRQPDYRGPERTFQLLCQVAGRAGRGALPGEVIVQTYAPEHYAIRHGVQQDFDAFAEEELALRAHAGFPPFGHLVRLLAWSPNARAAEDGAVALGEALRPLPEAVSLWGPSEAPLKQLRGQFRWHLALQGPDGAVLRSLAARALGACARHARGVHLAADPDPVSML